jgi:hypothetical protein
MGCWSRGWRRIKKWTHGVPGIESGSLEKWTIYSYRAHNATSLVPAVLLSGRASLEEFWRFWEIKAADSGPTSFKLVVISSCIELGFLFLGRVCTKGRTGVFVGVGPPVCGRSRKLRAQVCAYNLTIRTWGHPNGDNKRTWHAHLCKVKQCIHVRL